MSKYSKLWSYLKDSKKDSCKLTFNEIKEISGVDIDHSFLTYKKEAAYYGYEVKKISLKEKNVIFTKITTEIK